MGKQIYLNNKQISAIMGAIDNYSNQIEGTFSDDFVEFARGEIKTLRSIYERK